MKWKIQVRVQITSDESEWRDVRPTGGSVYLFDSEEQARDTARMCYPECNAEQVRVVTEGGAS